MTTQQHISDLLAHRDGESLELEVAARIEGFGGLYRKMNSLYGQAVRRRRLLAEVAEAMAL